MEIFQAGKVIALARGITHEYRFIDGHWGKNREKKTDLGADRRAAAALVPVGMRSLRVSEMRTEKGQKKGRRRVPRIWTTPGEEECIQLAASCIATRSTFFFFFLLVTRTCAERVHVVFFFRL